MEKIEWEAYRDLDGYIDLVTCFLDMYPLIENSGPAQKFLQHVMELTQFRSRQAAAVAIATAASLGESDD